MEKNYKEAIANLHTYGGVAYLLNHDITQEQAESVPLMQLMKAFLQFIIDKGGKLKWSPEQNSGPDYQPFIDGLIDDSTVKMGVLTSSGDPGVKIWLRVMTHLLKELKMLQATDHSLAMTIKGFDLVEGENTLDVYFDSIAYYTTKLNWFGGEELPDSVSLIQKYSSDFLYTLQQLDSDSALMLPGLILEKVNTVVSLLPAMAEENVPLEEASEIYYDHFLLGYCYLTGFVDLEKRGLGYKPVMSDLLNDLIQWEKLIA
ncbi:hypothetical protein [Spirochaeta cellobiosiphila]|uniref:hypothetical protein n=1 Tax=Spirochaeta cellobiosiphila TaxID=504483 RepID=UPI0004234B40|nr:hypothetical protein [Spirochaeta cellobiosiphila]